jgi:Tol biopolymer transport system component
MTQPPPGPPGSAGGEYPRDQGYAGQDYPHGYAAPGQSQPRYLPPAYPPGQEPLPPRRRQPRGSPVIAPVLALIGLVLVAGASIWGISFLNATLDESAAVEASAAPLEGETALASDAPVDTTPDPAQPATPPPATQEPTIAPLVIEAPPGQGAEVKGTIVFTRGGNIWAASGRELRRLTDSNSIRSDSSPVWAPDGKNIYFIRTSKKETQNSRPGGKYTLYPTDLMKIKADGSNKKTVYDSAIRAGGDWFSHVLQPSASANDRSVAVVSDGPDGNGPVVLHVINAKTGKIAKVPVPSEGDLGHNNPAFSPDGTRIAYTYNDNAGTDGMPRIGIHTCVSRANCTQGKNKLLRPGYANPSWSPNGELLAVEATSGKGRDIAIITVRRGDVRVKLTDDGNSFAPVFSPDGDQIVYLHRDGTDIDLRVMTLEIDERGKISLIDDLPVTRDGGVDGESTPSWFIPASERTNVAPEATPSESAEGTTDAVDLDAPEADETPDPAADPASEGAPPPPGS